MDYFIHVGDQAGAAPEVVIEKGNSRIVFSLAEAHEAAAELTKAATAATRAVAAVNAREAQRARDAH